MIHSNKKLSIYYNEMFSIVTVLKWRSDVLGTTEMHGRQYGS